MQLILVGVVPDLASRAAPSTVGGQKTYLKQTEIVGQIASWRRPDTDRNTHRQTSGRRDRLSDERAGTRNEIQTDIYAVAQS